LYLVFEHMSMDLRKYMDTLGKEPMPGDTVRSFLYQVFFCTNQFFERCENICLLNQMTAAILFCHKRRVLHRDLKPQNLLVDESRRVIKIADFGLGRAFGVPVRAYTHEVFTRLVYLSTNINCLHVGRDPVVQGA
jgi:cyclin-dependent kinase 1